MRSQGSPEDGQASPTHSGAEGDNRQQQRHECPSLVAAVRHRQHRQGQSTAITFHRTDMCCRRVRTEHQVLLENPQGGEKTYLRALCEYPTTDLWTALGADRRKVCAEHRRQLLRINQGKHACSRCGTTSTLHWCPQASSSTKSSYLCLDCHWK